MKVELWITDPEPKDSTLAEDKKAYDDISLFFRELMSKQLNREVSKVPIEFGNH